MKNIFIYIAYGQTSFVYLSYKQTLFLYMMYQQVSFVHVVYEQTLLCKSLMNKLNLRNRAALAVNCLVIINYLEVSPSDLSLNN